MSGPSWRANLPSASVRPAIAAHQDAEIPRCSLPRPLCVAGNAVVPATKYFGPTKYTGEREASRLANHAATASIANCIVNLELRHQSDHPWEHEPALRRDALSQGKRLALDGASWRPGNHRLASRAPHGVAIGRCGERKSPPDLGTQSPPAG